MKIEAIFSGTVAAKLIPEKFLPDHRTPQPDFLAAIQQRYGFLARGDASGGSPILFQNGRCTIADAQPLQFSQLQIARTGGVVSSQDTNAADLIMNDLLRFFVSEFDYRIEIENVERFYVSDIVVEFDGDRNNVLSSLFFLEKTISAYSRRSKVLRQLVFGEIQKDSGLDYQASLGPIDAIEGVEFIIERRVDSLLEDNRYFCRAPVTTEDHIKLLQEIEDTISA